MNPTFRAVLFLIALHAPAVHAESTKDMELDDLLKAVADKQGGVKPQGSRTTAIRELVRRQDPKGVDGCLEVFADSYAHQREAVLLAVSQAEDEAFLTALLNRGLRDKEELVRAGVIRAVALGERVAFADIIAESRKDRSPLVRAAVAEAAGHFARAQDLAIWGDLVKSREPEVRREVGRALCNAADRLDEESRKSAVVLVAQLDSDRDSVTRSFAVEARARLEGAESLEAVKAALTDKAEEVRVGALLAYRVLGQTNDMPLFEAAVEATIQALGDKAWRVRATAIENTVELWDQRFIEPVVTCMKAEDGRLRLDCAFALTLLCNYDLGTDASGWANWWQAQKKNFEMPKQPKRGKYGFARTLAAGDGSTSFFDIPVLSKRCIFQFDFSGSMAWEIEDYRRDPNSTVAADEKTKVTKVSIAQDEAEAVVDKLAPDAFFNFQIHRYQGARNPPNEEMLRAFPKLSPASPKSRAHAKKWVRGTEVDGWGAFYNALTGAIDDDDVDTIFLLTDGQPTGGERADKDRFIAGIIEHNRTRKVTIHAILMKNNEDGYNKYAISFMEEIAQATGGLCVQH